jgi:translocon-associated protein subunit beta
VQGFSVVNWAKISPSANVSHVAIVKPKVFGLHNFTHATVTYNPTERGDVTIIGYSSELGPAYIQTLKEYNRRFAPHTVSSYRNTISTEKSSFINGLFFLQVDWILFVVMTLPSILFPYILWYSSKRKYETVLANHKKEKST